MSQGLSNKYAVPGMGSVSLGWWSGEFKRLQKQYRLLPLSEVASTNLKIKLYY